jgi:FeS assembly protein IscX
MGKLRLTPVGCAGNEREGHPVSLSWTDTEDIAIALYEKHPEIDPLKVRFTDLHRWVTELEEFGDDAKASNESKLEAIQMAWLEEYRDNQ